MKQLLSKKTVKKAHMLVLTSFIKGLEVVTGDSLDNY